MPSNLPRWAWATIAVILAFSGVILAYGGSSARANSDQGYAKSLKDESVSYSKERLKNGRDRFSPKERNTWNFGGGQLNIRVGNKWKDLGWAVFAADNSGVASHVEEQAVDWARGRLYDSADYGHIDEVYLVIYSKQTPCPNCALSFTIWEAQLGAAAGLQTLTKVTITLWTSNGNWSSPPVKWR